MKRRTLSGLMCILITSFVVAILAVSAQPVAAMPLHKIIVAMAHKAFLPGSEAIQYAVPLQMGYFEEEGLDVRLEPTSGSGAAVQLVSTGKTQFGQGNPGRVMGGIVMGAPVKLVFNYIPTYGSGLAVLEESDIRSSKDLKGKLVGVPSMASGRVPEAKAMIEAAGLKYEVDVRLVAVGVGAQAATALTSKKVDGVYLWDALYAAMEAQGIKLRVIKDVFPGAKKILDFGHFTNNKLIEEHPEIVAKFGRAAAKGTHWAIHNPEGALEMFYRTFPSVRAKEDKQRVAELHQLTSYIKAHEIEGTDLIGYGYYPDDYVAFTAEFLFKVGVLKELKDPRTFYTNRFLCEYNKFDPEAVAKAAREFKP